MAASFVVPMEYPFILMACVVICIECMFTALCAIAPVRMGLMNKEFMAQFKEEH